jgi:hypothetical protein
METCDLRVSVLHAGTSQMSLSHIVYLYAKMKNAPNHVFVVPPRKQTGRVLPVLLKPE